MILFFTEVLRDAYGEKFDEPLEGGGKRDITLGRACATALNASTQADQSEEEGKRFKRGMLAFEIVQAEKASKSLDLTAEDIALIKRRIATVFLNADVVRAAWMLLDPPAKAEA